ncbi:E3 ubiquitin-protein ligase KCMF1-like isoform X1 [Octopus vulgaris]|uniref:E3 ubiquitin-protein ligase KCMF1 n=1 Tax=Octopus vulgaris TaxID=6645 RepID=A0AA36BL43_OCTVU|nr:E3 ubiquitin-protein ligase KCMF1-like isoform X1 [Octopus vulgaris]
MSRHEGVSCDSCLKGNFRGKRYKCLVCYDYDLCANCYEAGATTTRHTTDHPVQCILTKADFELYYGGEALPAEQAQSFTCPYCGKMGFTEATLQEHVTSEHADASTEVVCPICAALPGGDPNHSSGMRHVRRIPHPARGVGSTRSRRANMHIPPGGSTLSGLSPNGRESMDPIAELLSQLSSVRSRAAAAQSVSSQLQQLEMQLQSTKQQLERLPRRQAEIPKPPAVTTTTTTPNSSTEPPSASSSNTSNSNSQFLLPRCMEFALSEGDQSILEMDHSLFVQEVLLSTLDDELQPLFLEKMIQLEIGSGVNPQEKAPNIGGGSGSSSGGRSGSDNSSGGTVSGESSSSSSSNDTSLQKSTVKSKATRQRPLESSLHNQPKGSGSSGNSNCSSGGNGSAGSCSSSGATSSGASCGSSNIAGGGTQNITVIKQMSASSNSASRSASGTSPISATSQSSSLTQANLVLLSGQGSNIGRGLNTGGQGVGNMVGGSATSQAQSRSTGLREPLVSTSSAKRYMLKHLEATKASDREPPPH